ncbi:hypothetical protein ACIO93_35755 [Streptomyces sp. NPDC087903]|uniref:hypothetical protein n=1 Tax=Streptomyces sp. NPDC087903 TaxID=3365819 RepID=UPI003809EDD4
MRKICDEHGIPRASADPGAGDRRTRRAGAERERGQAQEKQLGLRGFAPDIPLRRFRLDVAIITCGPQFSPSTAAEDYGRVLFGPGAAAVPMP